MRACATPALGSKRLPAFTRSVTEEVGWPTSTAATLTPAESATVANEREMRWTLRAAEALDASIAVNWRGEGLGEGKEMHARRNHHLRICPASRARGSPEPNERDAFRHAKHGYIAQENYNSTLRRLIYDRTSGGIRYLSMPASTATDRPFLASCESTYCKAHIVSTRINNYTVELTVLVSDCLIWCRISIYNRV